MLNDSTLAEARKKIAKFKNSVSSGYIHTVGLKTDGTVIVTECIKKHMDYGQSGTTFKKCNNCGNRS